jgi:hypothetical protein
MNTFSIFHQKIRIWNTNFNSLRANVGVILKRQGGGLDGGSTLNQQSATKEQYLISVKKQL